MSVTKKVRFEVFKRDSFTCQYCGKSAPEVVLHLDHISPRAKGGPDDITNLVTACVDCNLGKKDRELTDNSVLQKRKRQLDLLQERREQLEMLMEWQRGLDSLENETLTQIAEYWAERSGYSLNDNGLHSLKKWLRKFSVSELMDAFRTAIDAYGKVSESDDGLTHESIALAYSKIPGIANTTRRSKDQPYLRNLYYIRGILRNRLSYINEWQCLALLKEAVESGVSVETLQQFALEVSSWTRFRNEINDLPASAPDGTDSNEIPCAIAEIIRFPSTDADADFAA